jgi:hypothetical protein
MHVHRQNTRTSKTTHHNGAKVSDPRPTRRSRDRRLHNSDDTDGRFGGDSGVDAMTPEELRQAAAVMLAAADGKDVEWSDNGQDWYMSGASSFFDWKSCKYRVAITKPSINWDHVNPDFNYLFMTPKGRSFVSRYMPALREGAWFDTGHEVASMFSSFKAGTCDWKDSLVVRPGVEK